MISIGITSHIYSNTPIALKVFPGTKRDGHTFVSLQFTGADGVDLSLLANAGNSEVLRRLAQVATEGADELDRLAESEGGEAA
ncbi:hypothetical protein ABZ369_06545 [Streptomyces sp. NPDC005918]|uniref:hypothetical protein n=1 Tax=Streptomyces sp. NPDC005918 TaxID=3155454 RepID=UPI0033F09B43